MNESPFNNMFNFRGELYTDRHTDIKTDRLRSFYGLHFAAKNTKKEFRSYLPLPVMTPPPLVMNWIDKHFHNLS